MFIYILIKVRFPILAEIPLNVMISHYCYP